MNCLVNAVPPLPADDPLFICKLCEGSGLLLGDELILMHHVCAKSSARLALAKPSRPPGAKIASGFARRLRTTNACKDVVSMNWNLRLGKCSQLLRIYLQKRDTLTQNTRRSSDQS